MENLNTVLNRMLSDAKAGGYDALRALESDLRKALAMTEKSRRTMPHVFDGTCYECARDFQVTMTDERESLTRLPETCVECYEKGGQVSGLRAPEFKYTRK